VLVWSNAGKTKTRLNVKEWAIEMQNRGAGEILLTSIDKEGTWNGFELDIIKEITDAVSIPVIANGGAGSLSDIKDVVKIANASAVALGSMVVFQKKGMGVLINFPDRDELENILN
jgi:cyclase